MIVTAWKHKDIKQYHIGPFALVVWYYAMEFYFSISNIVKRKVFTHTQYVFPGGRAR